MDLDLYSFLLGGVVFLLGFLTIMAWVVPDKTATSTMTWLASRRNFSKIGFGLGVIMILVVLFTFAVALEIFLRHVQVDPWVYWVAIVGSAFALVSIATLLATEQKKVNRRKKVTKQKVS